MHLSFRALLFEWFCGGKFFQLGINVRLHAPDIFRTLDQPRRETSEGEMLMRQEHVPACPKARMQINR